LSIPSTSIERVPPQNLEAEQGVLGSMLLDRDAIARVVELVRPEDFYRDAHRRIYETVVELFERGEPVDLITATDRLRDKGQLDDVGGAAYVTGLLNSRAHRGQRRVLRAHRAAEVHAAPAHRRRHADCPPGV